MKTTFQAWLVPLGLGLALAGCNRDVPGVFPLAVGYQPLEAVEASWPAGTAAAPTPEAIGAPAMGRRDGHDYAHGRAYIHAPLAQVWAALQDPMTSRIHGPSVEVLPGEEPFPLSFRLKYRVNSIIGPVVWEASYRGGLATGASGSPEAAFVRYEKIWGTKYINVQSGSLEAAPVDGMPDVTAVSFVCWLGATGQNATNAWGTVEDWFNDLVAKVHAPP